MSFNSQNYSSLRTKLGLTLIEVMVALVIFALVASAIVKAAGDNLGGVGQIENITFATWVANNRLTHLHLDKTWPVENNQSGSEDMAGRTWYWQQKVEKTNDKDMVLVEVTVGTDKALINSVTTITGFISKN
ncbi:type II secretion system minor pseudopilin GspI [Paraglaciecola aquimarina]|uniref:Type II secretion system protein I n=1 Tax=Paraglaciecola algarum TaxID=3050085 RepID=A0ABS9D3F9_9ALTE|nr:type II secretion system minor pseudopilin GspI [Paraglaciecola sp. G1-23]MCF2947421.1 type II secretion system minor pseudopilin GspI [Paraglaciecola sp. G1-23]